MGNRRFARAPTSDALENDAPPLRSESKRKRKLVHFSDEDEEEEEAEEGKVTERTKKDEDDDDEEEEDKSEEPEAKAPEEAQPMGAVVRVSGRGRGKRNHYESFEYNGHQYTLEDPALFHPENKNQKPYVAIIKDIAQTWDGELMVTGQWFYRPEEAEKRGGGNWQLIDTRELFYSFHRDEVPAESVFHKCVVHFIPLNKQIPPRQKHPGFFVQKVYDTEQRRLFKLTDKDYEENKLQEIDLLVQKTLSRLGDIPDLAPEETDVDHEDQLKNKRLFKRRSRSLLDVSRKDEGVNKSQSGRPETPVNTPAGSSEYYAVLSEFKQLSGETQRDKWLEKLLQSVQFICTPKSSKQKDGQETVGSDVKNPGDKTASSHGSTWKPQWFVVEHENGFFLPTRWIDTRRKTKKLTADKDLDDILDLVGEWLDQAEMNWDVILSEQNLRNAGLCHSAYPLQDNLDLEIMASGRAAFLAKNTVREVPKEVDDARFKALSDAVGARPKLPEVEPAGAPTVEDVEAHKRARKGKGTAGVSSSKEAGAHRSPTPPPSKKSKMTFDAGKSSKAPRSEQPKKKKARDESSSRKIEVTRKPRVEGQETANSPISDEYLSEDSCSFYDRLKFDFPGHVSGGPLDQEKAAATSDLFGTANCSDVVSLFRAGVSKPDQERLLKASVNDLEMHIAQTCAFMFPNAITSLCQRARMHETRVTYLHNKLHYAREKLRAAEERLAAVGEMAGSMQELEELRASYGKLRSDKMELEAKAQLLSADLTVAQQEVSILKKDLQLAKRAAEAKLEEGKEIGRQEAIEKMNSKYKRKYIRMMREVKETIAKRAVIDFVESPMFYQASVFKCGGDMQEGFDLCLAQLRARGYLTIADGELEGVGLGEEDPRPPKEDPTAVFYEANPDDYPYGFVVKKLQAENQGVEYDGVGWPEDYDLSLLDSPDGSSSPNPRSPAAPSRAPTEAAIDVEDS